MAKARRTNDSLRFSVSLSLSFRSGRVARSFPNGERRARACQRSFDPRHSVSANRNSTGERSHRALIPHANFRKRAPHTTLPPSSILLILLAFLRLILLELGDSPLYCFSNKSLSGSYALPLHIGKSTTEQISNLLLHRPAKTRKLKAFVALLSYQFPRASPYGSFLLRIAIAIVTIRLLVSAAF